MYTVVKNVIAQGGYDLTSLRTKIDTLWVQGSINDEQKDELITAAQNGAMPKDSIDLMSKLEELDRRVKALEEGGGNPAVDTSEFEVGKWYYAGDTCLFNGDKYTCIAPNGVVCVWSPADYPAYWEKT